MEFLIVGKISYHRFYGWELRLFLSVLSVKSVVEFIRLRLLCVLRMIVSETLNLTDS